MGVFLSHPNHRSKPYLISTLAGWRDQESARHTWVCPVLTLSWVRYGFRSYHMREHQRSNLSSWEWCQMALCVIYPVPGLLHSKGKDGNLKQCQPGTILPPELGLQDLQEPQRTVITNYSWLASVVAYERISFTSSGASGIRTPKAANQTETSRTLWPLGHGDMPENKLIWLHKCHINSHWY